MSDTEINSELEKENNQNANFSNEEFLIQKNKWEETKSIISRTIKEIFWEAWIKPLKFDKYDKGILHLSSDSKIIEIQVSAEKEPFSKSDFDKLIKLAIEGTNKLFSYQLEAIK